MKQDLTLKTVPPAFGSVATAAAAVHTTAADGQHNHPSDNPHRDQQGFVVHWNNTIKLV